jgi:hypothetical protein
VIVSHRHRFVFVKTRKTGGTSVEISLSRYCGPDDVITPIVPEDEALRTEGPGPQNWDRPARWREVDWRSRQDLGHLRRGRMPRRPVLRNHSTAARAIEVIGREAWDEYATFAFARNPWDAVVSRLFWERQRRGRPDLTVDDVIEMFDPAFNWSAYTIDDEVVVDRVYDFRQLHEGVAEVTALVGIEWDGWLPHAKAATGRSGASYRDVLEPRHVELIAERCAREIAYMGYEY